MITAIANNELEVSNLAYSSLAIAIENAGLDDIRVIADEFQDGVPGYYTQEYFVRKDSGIDKVEDLKGKVIGTNAGGSAVDIAMRAMLRKHGLEEKRDYTMNSFIGISKSHTTNLAVVAPGIAEALLATALGLVAAIPAVVMYNMFSRWIAGYRALHADAAAEILRIISRDLDRGAFNQRPAERRRAISAAE